MAITTYGTLKTAIADWVHRSDLTTTIATCVALTETDISVDVRCQAMETVTVGTLSGATLSFPTSLVEARRLLIGNDVYRFVTPELFSEKSAQSSQDHVYTILGRAFYILNAASGDAYTLTYYARFDAFSSDSDTNWLVTNHPDVYLFGALKHLMVFTQDDNQTMKFSELYRGAVTRVNTREAKAAASGGPLQMFAANVE